LYTSRVLVFVSDPECRHRKERRRSGKLKGRKRERRKKWRWNEKRRDEKRKKKFKEELTVYFTFTTI
jgi:hypothetical protein